MHLDRQKWRERKGGEGGIYAIFIIKMDMCGVGVEMFPHVYQNIHRVHSNKQMTCMQKLDLCTYYFIN